LDAEVGLVSATYNDQSRDDDLQSEVGGGEIKLEVNVSAQTKGEHAGFTRLTYERAVASL
jgi:hypothetical protein